MIRAAWVFGLTGLAWFGLGAAERPGDPLGQFQRLRLSDRFYGEGVAVGDLNRDGSADVVAGPFWYAGPSFAAPHEYRPVRAFDPAEYSDNFLTYTHDFNGDGWVDILVIDIPSKAAHWYENRRGAPDHWTRHLAFEVVDNESPLLADLTGDGKPELVFNTGGYLGYAAPDWANPAAPWRFHPLSPEGKWHKYTHGLGVADVNGDGRRDFLEIGGWWQQPPSLAHDPVWTLHRADFGQGGAQMFACDFDGDGDQDVLTVLHPHKYGLAWFEQRTETRPPEWSKHLILGEPPSDNPVSFSQMHALELADVDGDGVQDFITGKRWWAHKPPLDPDSDAPAVLYWFRTVRRGGPGQVDFVPHLVDDDSGVGMQVVAADLNGDRATDIAVANKKGTFVFLQQAKPQSSAPAERAQPRPGPPKAQSLFNGRDLTGWTVKCKPEDRAKTFWRVEQSAIVADSLADAQHDYVWLVSEREFSDFELRLKFRSFYSSPGNSGVQIRSRYDDEAGWLDGPQVDVNPAGPWRTGMIWDETRGNQRWLYPDLPKGQWVNEAMAPPGLRMRFADSSPDPRGGEPASPLWNDLRIVARGFHVSAWLNGVKITSYDGAKLLNDETHRARRVGERGHLALQIHTGDRLRIEFKDLELLE